MKTSRLEAFSDGVLAIIITIMVLELKTPHDVTLVALKPMLPVFLGYLLSFIYVGIYWNNHHHLMTAVEKINGKVLWANLHLLFWLSLIPFATAWLGQNYTSPAPLALYGFILLMAAVAYAILLNELVKVEGKEGLLAKAVGKDIKGKLSIILYVIAILSTLFLPIIAGIMYVIVAIIWFVPDKRIEKIK